jgi:hypothetical protein
MAEAEEEVDGVAGVGGDSAVDAGERSDPENGRTGAAKRLQRAAEKALGETVPQIVTCLVTNIGANHLPSAKMLIDLAEGRRRDEDRDEIPAEEYRSLAELLWKELEEQETEQGPGNRE